jgi:hypothetical protein
MARKKIPNLNVRLEFGADINLLHKNPQIKELIYANLVLGIKEANNSNRNEATIVELHSSGNYVQIDRNSWKPSLETAINYFLSIEAYEKCNEIQKLIESIDSYGTQRIRRTSSRTNKSNNRS